MTAAHARQSPPPIATRPRRIVRRTSVAQAYARFARDYREGTHLCPTFDDAVTRHRMLNAIETAAATGQRHTLRGSGEVLDRQLGRIAVTVGSI